jgi:hypothetical protein
MSRSQSKAEYGRFAHLFVGGIEWLLTQWQALTGGEETDLHSHAASGGGSGLQVVTIPITSVQLHTLDESFTQVVPILLVDAPGSGRMIVPFAIGTVGDPGTTPYEDDVTVLVVAGDVIQPSIEGNVWWSFTLFDLVANGTSTNLFAVGQPHGTYGLVNKGLYLVLPNPSPNTNAGDGSFVMTVAYFVAGSA